MKTALSVLLLSYSIEILEYFHIVNIPGLQDIQIARVIIGTSFAWMDLIAYTLGIGIVLYLEKVRARRVLQASPSNRPDPT